MKRIAFVAVLASCFFGAGILEAQSFTFTASDEAGLVGGTASVAIDFDTSDPIDGWSFGFCNDFSLVSLTTGDVANGAGTSTANGGAAPFFHAVTLVAGQGFTVGVLVSFSGNQLPAGVSNMYNVTYDLLAEGTAALTFCSIGTPITEVNVVFAGSTVIPDTNEGSIAITAPVPFVFGFNKPAPVGYDPETGVAAYNVQTTIVEDAASSPTFPSNTQGASMSFSYDAALVTAVSANPGVDLAFLANGPGGPAFFGPLLTVAGPGGETGVTVGLVFDFFGVDFVVFDTELEVMDVGFEAVAGALVGDLDGATTSLTYMTLGDPAVENSVVVGGAAVGAAFEDSSINLVPVIAIPFVGGDCNDDGIENIADGIWILNELFLNGPASTCLAACDANGDSVLDQSDAVYILNHQFLGGPPSAGPSDCGILSDDQSCESADSCG